jgi:hypothetical protein
LSALFLRSLCLFYPFNCFENPLKRLLLRRLPLRLPLRVDLEELVRDNPHNGEGAEGVCQVGEEDVGDGRHGGQREGRGSDEEERRTWKAAERAGRVGRETGRRSGELGMC